MDERLAKFLIGVMYVLLIGIAAIICIPDEWFEFVVVAYLVMIYLEVRIQGSE